MNHFTEYYTQVANKHMKRCLISLAIRETQIKTMMFNEYTSVRTTNIKILNIPKAGQDAEQLHPS